MLKIPDLWTSPYSPYQQELFDIITQRHEEDGWNFKQISDWFNDNGYETSRGKKFKQNHVHSIYSKKKKSIKRFSRQFDPFIDDMTVDIIDYIPEP